MNKIHRRVAFLVMCFFSLLLLASLPTAKTDRAGLVISVSGEVTVSHGKGPERVTEGYALQEGDTVVVKMGAKCSGFGLGGEPFRLTGPARLILTSSTEGGARNIAGWIADQVAQWSGRSRSKELVSRGIRDRYRTIQAPAPLIPADDGRVRVSSSSFCWMTVEGVDQYKVTIAPVAGDESHYTVRGHEFTLDDLQPGAEYVWKVSADVGTARMSSRWSSFRVMTPEEEQQVEEAQSALSDLEAGVMLAAVGLHEEAISRLDAAVDSDTTRQPALFWRAKVFASIGLYKEAYDDITEATGR